MGLTQAYPNYGSVQNVTKLNEIPTLYREEIVTVSDQFTLHTYFSPIVLVAMLTMLRVCSTDLMPLRGH